MKTQLSGKKTYFFACCALFAALMCIFGPLSIPIGPVPISLTTLVISLSVYLLGAWGATVSTVIYLLLGLVGLPVFSGFSGGVAKFAGPTGGYLIGFVFLAFIGGVFLEKSHANIFVTAFGLVVGTLVLYVFGTVWFMVQMNSDLVKALTLCVIPFIPFDLIKIVLASILGIAVRRALKRASLLPDKVS